jgi:hypothetical protein
MVLLSELEAEVINSWMYLKCRDFEDIYDRRTTVALKNTITTPPSVGALIVISSDS